MKKKIVAIILAVLFSVVLIVVIKFKQVRERSITVSLIADTRFIRTAADHYFLENKKEENVTLERLIAWTNKIEGEKNWTMTLDPEATYKCDLNRTESKIVVEHPRIKSPVIWDTK